MGEYSFESFYEGGNFLVPEYGTGIEISTANLGFPGSVRTANQVGEVANAVKQGVKAFEVTMAAPETAIQIPKHHFDEMRALMKLSGVKPSVHGPLLDPAGFGQRGWEGDQGRADVQRQMFDAVEKAHTLDPKGNTPIVFHASNTGGREHRIMEEGGKREKYLHKSVAVHRETGQLIPLEREMKFRPDDPENLDKKGTEFTVKGQVRSANLGEWDNKMTELATFNKNAEELLAPSIRDFKTGAFPFKDEDSDAFVDAGGKLRHFKDKKPIEWTDEKLDSYNQLKKADVFLENVDLNFKSAFGKAFKFGNDNQKNELKKLSKGYIKGMKSIIPGSVLGPVQKQEVLEGAIRGLQDITTPKEVIENGEIFQVGVGDVPQIYQEIGDFAKDKSSDTFSNLAYDAYKKYGDNSPIIAIENLPEHMGVSTAEELRDLINESREKFAKKLEEEKGLGEDRAMDVAKKYLGATWDVGHISTLRKRGFTNKEIVEETKKIAEDPTMVKHLHINDNFGYADSELLPGMGDAPLKEMLKEIEKTGDVKKMRKIVEASGAFTNFQDPFHAQTLSSFGSPIYGMKMAPDWQGSYFGGYGTINPETHHGYFGAGFTTMPVEFGGQMAGGQSRFGGTPMA